MTRATGPSRRARADLHATWSMALGMASVLCLALTGVPALILGLVAQREVGPKGKLKAQIGIGLGALSLPLTLVVGLTAALLAAAPDDGPSPPLEGEPGGGSARTSVAAKCGMDRRAVDRFLTEAAAAMVADGIIYSPESLAAELDGRIDGDGPPDVALCHTAVRTVASRRASRLDLERRAELEREAERGRAAERARAAEREQPRSTPKTKGGPACLSRALWDEMLTYTVNKDKRGTVHMLSTNKCILIKEGLDVSFLDSTWTGTVKIRVYEGTESAVLWTASEFVEE